MASRSASRHNKRVLPALTFSFTPQTFALPGFLTAAVALGGASAAGLIPNLLLQLIAIGLMFTAAVWPVHCKLEIGERSLLWIGLAFLVVALLQLIPLPPAIWSGLPNRAAIVREFQLLGAPLPWLPLSLNPSGTIAGLLGLTVAAGMFGIVRKAGEEGLTAFAWTIVALAALSAVIGFLQLASGGQSPLYLYAFTNRDQPVGFFANSNHLATLELAAMPFLAALAAKSGRNDEVQRRARNYVLLLAIAVLLLLGLVTNGSLAGLGLLLPTLIGCFFLVRRGSRRIAAVGLGVAILLVLGFVILALSSPILSGFAQTSISAAPTSRAGFIHHSLEAVAAYFPLGSGLGSFTAIFPAFEDPGLVESAFVNHAHNDYLELAIELGLPGMLLTAAFLGWWAWRTIAIWRDPETGAVLRAATVASAAVLAHSLVDYPLRTAAMLAIFTACCTMMARQGRTPPPPPPVREDLPAARHLAA